MFYLRIFLNKEFYLSTIRTLLLNTIDKQKKRRPLSNVIKLRDDEPSGYYCLDGIFI